MKTWRVNHWEKGETAALGPIMGEEAEPSEVDDDFGEEEGFQESAKHTLAMLQTGRPLDDEEILGCTFFIIKILIPPSEQS